MNEIVHFPLLRILRTIITYDKNAISEIFNEINFKIHTKFNKTDYDKFLLK